MPFSEFYRARGGVLGLHSWCKGCAGDAERIRPPRKPSAETVKKNALKRETPEHKAYHRDWWLRNAYGISARKFDAILARQGGTCKICPSAVDLVVDHDHDDGRVRGILCTGCNIKLGGYEAMKKLGSKLDLYLRGDSHGTPNNR
jgi:hypothetical protein